jgi:hypothetical protein
MRSTFSKFVEAYFSSVDSTPETVNAILAEVDFETWIYGVGTDPSGTLDFWTDEARAAEDLAN